MAAPNQGGYLASTSGGLVHFGNPGGTVASGTAVEPGAGGKVVYRGGSRTPGNMTPRPGKDSDGLSTWRGIGQLAGNNSKAQAIDLNKLSLLHAVEDAQGHVSLTTGDPALDAEWALTLGTSEIHPFTQEILDAWVGEVSVP